MDSVKRKSNLTWEEIADSIGVSRSMVFFYLDGSSRMPLVAYSKLCSLGNMRLDITDYIEINNKTRIIKKPKRLNGKFAELLGILAGDGHLSNINYEVSVSGNLKEGEKYMVKHVKRSFERLFDCHVRIYRYKPNNNIKCIVNSKMLVGYLNNKFRIPIGKKKGRLHIPSMVLKRDSFLKDYIRGLFDTDGSIYLRREKDMVISIIARDGIFLNEVKKALIKLGYSPTISGKNLYLYKQEEIKRFFKDIRPRYTHHLERYNFLKNKR